MTPAIGRPPRSTRALLAALVLTLTIPLTASGAVPRPAPLVSSTISGAVILPLINSGDTRNGVTFEGIPDGLGIAPVGDGDGQIDIFVAFEQSHVPFGGFADFEDSSVQRVRLNLDTLQATQVKEMLPATAGFVRFCSATMLGPDQGFDKYTFLVNEESVDYLPLTADGPYGADASISGTYQFRQAGYSVALDAKSGSFDTISRAGRLNHENTVVVPGGWDDVVALTGDDTFAAPSSQLYMYAADDQNSFLGDEGSLWAFQVTGRNGVPLLDPYDSANDANDYLEIAMGDDLQGRFIPVPDDIATGTTATPPQQALEDWSNQNNVFQFVRVEDIAYDPDSPTTVYFADTGTTRLQEAGSGRLIRVSATTFPHYDSDGRIFKMVLDGSDATVVDSLSIVAQGQFQRRDSASSVTVLDPGVGIVNPDNLGAGHDSLMVQEDSAGNNDVWRYTMGSGSPGTWTKVASATQTATAETSGIVDASQWLGAGWWVLDVQSHVNLPGAIPAGTWGDDPEHEPIYPLGPANASPYSLRRELGQLLLMYIPGS
jgi:hypothetical protein